MYGKRLKDCFFFRAISSVPLISFITFQLVCCIPHSGSASPNSHSASSGSWYPDTRTLRQWMPEDSKKKREILQQARTVIQIEAQQRIDKKKERGHRSHVSAECRPTTSAAPATAADVHKLCFLSSKLKQIKFDNINHCTR